MGLPDTPARGTPLTGALIPDIYFSYFEALSKGEPLPVKDRLEVPVGSALNAQLTKGFIEVLHKQVLIH